MKTFLEEVVEHILTHSQGKTDELCIVIPGKRPKMFIQKLMARKIGRAFWSPEIFSISEFFENISGKNSNPSFDILIEFYNWLKENIEYKESFEQYLKWAPTALADFSDVDRYLLDSKEVYLNLRRFKEIEDWSFEQEELSPDQSSFNSFWQNLGLYYQHYRTFLEELNMNSLATLSRFVAENIDEYYSDSSFSHIYFVGFNALTASEQKVVFTLVQQGVASVLWDSDKWYLENKIQEAGLFHRNYKRQIPEFIFAHDLIQNASRQIQIHQCSSHISQVHAAADLIHNLESDKNVTILLADESLALPLLSLISSSKHRLNISVGLPMSSSAIYSLFRQLKKLSSAVRKRSGAYILFDEFSSFCSNHLIREHVLSGETSIHAITKEIYKSNKNRIELSYLSNFDSEQKILESLFNWISWNNESKGIELLNYFRKLIQILDLSKELPDIDSYYLDQSSELISSLRDLIQRYPYMNELSVVFDLMETGMKSLEIPFLGDKSEGIQITGVLESRALDFDHVIMLGMNEGNFPKVVSNNSFFPFELRKYFGLPGREEQESIYAYYFYRLLHRSKKVDLFYNNMNESFGATEKSRFILQIEEEFHETSSSISRIEHSFTYQSDSQEGLIVQNSEELQELIEAALRRGISASGLNTFIECPQDFYFKYVLGFREPDEITGKIQASNFGTIIHDCLEELYDGVDGQLTMDHIESFETEFESVLKEKYNKELKQAEWKTGYNYLSYTAAKQYIKDFLRWEKGELKKLSERNEKLEIVALEKKVSKEIELKVQGRKLKVKLKGFIDRIDRIGNKYRIIDYKTGKVVSNDLVMNSDLDQDPFKLKPKALQILIYMFLFSEEEKIEWKNIDAGVVSFRNLDAGFIEIKSRTKIEDEEYKKDLSQNFERLLISLLEPMFDKNFSWEHNPKSFYCSYCD